MKTKKLIAMKNDLEQLVQQYADERGISFTAAVVLLLRQALYEENKKKA